MYSDAGKQYNTIETIRMHASLASDSPKHYRYYLDKIKAFNVYEYANQHALHFNYSQNDH